MAVARQLNVKGQMRIDVPHIRLLESGVVYDFDTLAGGIMAGKQPYVVKGFTLAPWTVGAPASTLSMVTADGIVVNYGASETGSMLMVPSDRAAEALTVTNSRVIGSFAVGKANFISIDFIRSEDETTADVVQFIDPTTGQSTPKIIPLARTLDYRIYISIVPFSGTPQRCPIAIVTTDSGNAISATTPPVDARPMMFRLAAGGDSPDPLSPYNWPQGRTEAANSFTGGDKGITNLKDWLSATEEMIWQINAGEFWYSNTQMTSTWFMPKGINVWSWDAGTSTLTWSEQLEIVFTGSTAVYNTIAANSQILGPDEAMYVDFNRYVDGTALTVHVGPIATLNITPTSPATPGIRYPIAWRVGSATPVVRNLPVPVGYSLVGLATTTVAGTVYINTPDATPYAVVSDGLGGNALAKGLRRSATDTTGILSIGTGTYDSSVYISKVGATTRLYGTLQTATITAENFTDALAIGRSGLATGSTNIHGHAITIGGSDTASTPTIGIGNASTGTITVLSGVGVRVNETVEATLVLGNPNAATQATALNGKTIQIGWTGQATTIGGASATISSTAVNVTGATTTISSPLTTISGTLFNSSSPTITLGTDNTATVNLGCGLGTGTSNTINIGNGHGGTGASTTTIGAASLGTSTVLGNVVNINTSGTGTTNVGQNTTATAVSGSTISVGGSVLTNWSTGNVTLSTRSVASAEVLLSAVGATSTIRLTSTSGTTILGPGGGVLSLSVDTSSATAPTDTVMNVKNNGTQIVSVLGSGKVIGGSATAFGDNALTLTTKGYVDSAVGGIASARMVEVSAAGAIVSGSPGVTSQYWPESVPGLVGYYTVDWGFAPTYVVVTPNGGRATVDSIYGYNSLYGYFNESSWEISGTNNHVTVIFCSAGVHYLPSDGMGGVLPVRSDHQPRGFTAIAY
jgi:hypothetical protein